MNFQPTTKESGLLKDMKGQEELCVKKYDTYAQQAHNSTLKALFTSLADNEREHLKTITELMNGTVTPVSGCGIPDANNQNCCAVSYANEEEKQQDAFLCRDMLAMEKHASSLYDVSVFEFGQPVARKVLNRIQAEEQQHGEQLYAYMKANAMYN
jgi:rubrerythrin